MSADIVGDLRRVEAERDALRAQVERVRALADEADRARSRCAESDECECTYKDCYEHGKWHNCTHTPWTQIRAALDAD